MSSSVALYEALTSAPDERTRARVIAEATERLEARYPTFRTFATQAHLRDARGQFSHYDARGQDAVGQFSHYSAACPRDQRRIAAARRARRNNPVPPMKRSLARRGWRLAPRLRSLRS